MSDEVNIPIDLEPDALARPKPTLPGVVVVKRSMDETLDVLMADLMIHARNCVRAFGDFHLAVLATPDLERVLARVLWDPFMREFPWTRTHLWLVDEIAGDSPRAREELARGLLVEQSDIPREQFHPIDAADATGEAYEAKLRETLGWREKGHDRLDFVLLSLDPSGPLLRAGPPTGADRLVAPAGHAGPGVCMTLEFLNASRFIAVTAVNGSESSDGSRAPQVAQVARAYRRLPREARLAPSQDQAMGVRLRPVAGELRWYLDPDAAFGGGGGGGDGEIATNQPCGG
ncbi:MAG: 6-phosphogluconolactonase [Planctomycetota bacterium]